MEKITIAVLSGDGIGPEVTREARQVLEVSGERHGFEIAFDGAPIGGEAIDACGEPLPEPTLRLAEASDAVLLGAVGGPKWDDPQSTVRPEQALLGLRSKLELFGSPDG